MFHKTNWRALMLAAIGFVTVTSVALALNVPSTAVFSARQNTTQQTNYYRFQVNYNDPRISTGVKFGRLPSNAFVSTLACHVTTAFNAATTNVFTVGTSTTATEIIGASDVTEASAQYQALTSAPGLGVAVTSAGEVDLYAKYTQTGTAATAGAVTCVIEYVPDNDK